MITTRKLRNFIVAVAISIPAAAATNPSSLRDTAQRFANAYGGADAVVLRSLWSGDRAFLRAVTTKARVRCLEPAGAIVTSVDDATGIARATIGRWESVRDGSATPKFVVKHLVVTFEPRDGAWKATKFDLAESAIASQLVANPESAASILRANDEFVTPDLAAELLNHASALTTRGDVKKAEVVAHLIDDVASLIGDPDAASSAKVAWAQIRSRQGDARGELAVAQEALALAERNHDPDVLLRALVEAGHATERFPESDEAVEKIYERGRLLADLVYDRVVLGHLFLSSATLRLRHGDSIGAITNGKKAYPLFAEQEDDRGLALVSQLLAVTLVNQGDNELARQHALRGLEAATRAKDDSLHATFLTVLAHIDATLGDYGEAQSRIQEALTYARQTNDMQIIAECLRVSGMVHFYKHEYPAAVHDFEESVKAHQKAARPRLAAISMVALARAKLEGGDARGAIETGEPTATIAQKLGLHQEFEEVKEIAGRAHHRLGEDDAALRDFNDAIDDAETRRPWIAGDAGAQERGFETASVPYRRAAELLAERGRLDEAFTMAERGKARVLLDTLRSGRERIDEVMTAEERKHDRDLSNAIAALNRKLTAETLKPSRDAAAITKLTNDLRDARTEYETYQTTLYAGHARLRQTHGDVPIATRADVKQLLDAQSAIVMYQVMEDKTIALVLRRDDIKRFEVNLDREALSKRVAGYATSLSNRDLGYRTGSRALYDLLLQPMEAALRGATTICIIPDDVLWQVPFESLIDRRGKFVVESRACFYAQSVSVLAEITRGAHSQPAPYALLAVGNPKISAATQSQSKALYRDASLLPLPNAEEEVKEIKNLYPKGSTHVYTGSAANEAAVKAEMSQFRILHFATHAEFNDENPIYAHIVLAQDQQGGDDGLLEAWEIMRMNLHADIAVLSACETAKGRVASGEGIIGFSWALFVAGCPSSVVSHWKVASDSTAKLMVDFHKHLRSDTGPFSRAAALRKAKLDMLHNAKWSHPFYWSAFVLIGKA